MTNLWPLDIELYDVIYDVVYGISTEWTGADHELVCHDSKTPPVD